MNSHFFAIFIASAIHGALGAWWISFKKRQATKPTTMKLRKGVYVPWGPVQRLEWIGNLLLIPFALWFILLFSALAYKVITGDSPFNLLQN